MSRQGTPELGLRPWSDGDLPLLSRTMGDPAMTAFLGGPENDEQLLRRQRRYLELAGTGRGRMFTIVAGPEAEPVGSVGYWEKHWRGQVVYEMGWSVLAAFQGQGVGARATAAAVGVARSEAKHRFLHAFPSVANTASNAICRKVGFSLLEECDLEYPPGHLMRCNDWRLDLLAA